MNGDEPIGCRMRKIHSLPMTSVPPKPKPRRSLRLEGTKESCSLNNNFQNLEMERETSRQRKISNSSKAEEESFRSQSTSCSSTQMTESSSEEDEKTLKDSPYRPQNRSRTISPEIYVYKNCLQKKPQGNTKLLENKQNSGCLYFFIGIIIVIGIVIRIVFYKSLDNDKAQTQSIIFNPLTEVKNLKATFYNQESDIWNDISSAINELISRTPKIPSIILLFAEETTTMNCLATKLANMSSIILNADSYLIFNPEHFGNDAGEIITILNEHSPEKKKVVIIHDILNINAEAIKGLHNLCDRINPLVAEAIYILTMQTNSSQSRQKKLNFVENQIYNQLSKSINQNVLMALVTRITDGVIIPVQSEPQLRYC